MKYHLGTSFDRPTSSGKRVHISLLANPSHLEAVNTIEPAVEPASPEIVARQLYRARQRDRARHSLSSPAIESRLPPSSANAIALAIQPSW